MTFVWKKHLTSYGFDLVDWDYHWYGVQFELWGIGIVVRTKAAYKQRQTQYRIVPSAAKEP